MQTYRKKNTGFTFIVEQAAYATPIFCELASYYGISLFTANLYDPQTGQWKNTGVKFFATQDLTACCSPRDFLALEYPPESKNYNFLFLTPVQLAFDYTLVDDAEEKPAMQTLKGKSFYLDAGHGGKDSGAVNDKLNLQEKHAALAICKKLGTLLEQRGAKVSYSREGDDYPSLTTRADIANALNVTAFISIHLNSAENKSASGIETLVYALKGTAFEIATLVQKNMVEATGWKNRGVKARPNLTVLKQTKMPAILIECGFISNDEEAKLLFSDTTQNELVNAISNGIIEFYK